MAPEMQEEEGISVKWYIFNLVLQDPGHGTKIMRGKDGFSDTVTIYASARCHNNPGHSTRNARGISLQVYINI